MGIEIKKRESFLELCIFFVTDVDDDVGFHKKNPSLCRKHLCCVIKDGNLVRHPAAAGFLRWGAMVTPFTPADWKQK